MARVTLSPFITGIMSAAGMLAFYGAVTSLVSGTAYAARQFVNAWYWIAPLAAGFGLHVGLYRWIRIRARSAGVGAVAGSAVTSGGAMAACCAHRLAEVFPLLGLSSAAAFLGQYQSAFFALGLASNLGGIAHLLKKGRHILVKEIVYAQS